MIIDGDDEIIGKHAFQVMNSAYQKDPNLWVVYSNYKTNYYQYGRSKEVVNDLFYKIKNRRLHVSSVGPLRTWRVKLIYQIPKVCHMMPDGEWLDTVYDDAI